MAERHQLPIGYGDHGLEVSGEPIGEIVNMELPPCEVCGQPSTCLVRDVVQAGAHLCDAHNRPAQLRVGESVPAAPDPAPPDEYLALTSLSVLDLRPGDVIVITDPQDRTRGERRLLAQEWADRFIGYEVIYLDGGRELGVLRRGEGG